MSTSTVVLALLERQSGHGYMLKRQYDSWFAQRRPLAFGQVYATLGRLQRDGLVHEVATEMGEGPERRRYEITNEGSSAVNRWVHAPVEPKEFAANDLCARVTVALLTGRSAVEVLDTQREAHLRLMLDLQRQQRVASGADLLVLTYRLIHLEADLQWIGQSGQRLDEVRAGLGLGDEDRG